MSTKSLSADGGEPKPPSKSKRIKRARKALVKAIEHHAEITTGDGVSLKKAQRAGAKVAAAAAEYAAAVEAKTGLDNPFVAGSGGLDGETLDSLRAERVKMGKTRANGVAAKADA